MAIKRSKGVPGEDFGLNEVDDFNEGRDKVLLNAAGEYGRPASDGDQSSDEEVLGVESGSEVEDDASEPDSEDVEEEEEEEEDGKGWGSKQNYYGGDDASDDEDMKHMTEEAIRQQKRHMEDLDMQDYVDDDLMEDWKKTAKDYDEESDPSSNLLSASKDFSFETMDDSEKLKLLKSFFPEFIPLVKELSQYFPVLAELKEVKDSLVSKIKFDALSAYMGAVSSYFAVFVEKLNSPDLFTSMKHEPVMETILSLRETWRQANDIPEDIPTTDKEDKEVADGTSIPEEKDSGHEDQEIPEEEDDDDNDDEEEEKEEEEEEEEEQEQEQDSPRDTNDLLNIDINSRRKTRKNDKFSELNDFTETATPDDVDMEDKRRRKRTLRFYTSKIDQAAAKNRDHYSGDMDLPYKERLYERQQRLLEEARKRGLGQDPKSRGKDLGDDESDHASDGEVDINEADEDYYLQVKGEKQHKKDARIKAHESAVKAAKEGKLEELEENIGDDGKRAVNYQILKNKGLTPHRNKDNRNARVKKRKKYEKAQKKLKSVRQVYDPSKTGPYEGEKTGIKKGLSRSVKFA